MVNVAPAGTDKEEYAQSNDADADDFQKSD